MGQESSHELIEDHVLPRTLESRTIQAVAEYIKDGKASRIVVLTGAGVSTSAGIPDFRSPKTGLYANLAKLNLPYAEAVFDISYFRNNPHPFYALAHELFPGKYKPTVAHAFIALLAQKKLLHMLFTQNIDCLERAAGVPGEKIVEAHGSFATQRCIECKTVFPDELMSKAIAEKDVPYCIVPQCMGLVKPDIVFFGEPLPDSFRQNTPMIAQADLVLIMGTSLSVQPFASLPGFVLEGVPRVLINLERVGGLGSRPDDVCILSECDEGIRNLADALGWREDLEALWQVLHGKREGAEDIAEVPKESKTKDELLEEEIAKLTSDVDHTLKITNGHKKWLEDHLGKKITKGPPDETSIVASEIADSVSQTVEPTVSKENATSAANGYESMEKASLKPDVESPEKHPSSASSRTDHPTKASDKTTLSENIGDSKPSL